MTYFMLLLLRPCTKWQGTISKKRRAFRFHEVSRSHLTASLISWPHKTSKIHVGTLGWVLLILTKEIIINDYHFLLQFTWKNGEGTTITEGMTSETEEIENTKRITAISTLKLTVKKTYHNKNITCEAMQANTF